MVAAGFTALSHSIGRDTSDNLSIPGSGANAAKDVLNDSLPQQANGTNPVVFKAKKGTLDSGANKQAVDQTVDSLKKAPHVSKVVSPYDDNDEALSKDKTIGYASVTLDLSAADLTEDEANRVIDATVPATKAGLEVEEAGYLGQAVSKPATESSEAIGLVAAVIILMFAFGSVTAALLPIATAIISLATGLSLIGFLGKLVEVPTVGPTLATMIGLGVGIDYALFIVTRHKQELQKGVEVHEAAARAVATSGSAVLFAGGTVVIALVSMAAAEIPLVTALGYTAAVTVLVAVTAALTLLPALLVALGPRINSLPVHLGKEHPDDKQPHGWRRWARGVCNHPWPAAIASTAILIVLAIPLLDLQLGQTDAGTDPKDQTTRKAYDLLSEGFGPGVNGPFLIAVQLNPPAKADQSNVDKVNDQQQQLDQQQQQATEQAEAQGLPPQQAQQQAEQETASQQQQLDDQKKQAENPAGDPRLTTLTDDLKKTGGVKEVSGTQLDSKGDAGVITLIPTTSPSDEKTADLVNTLRDKTIPPAEKGGLTADVGGQTAGYVDLADRISSKLPEVILIILGLSFVLLLIAFRSILLPLKAAFVNLLSVAAAYGVLTAVFQEGWGAELIGLDGPVPIQSFVPLFMFAILFGLSMDYEVFLLSQVKEHFEEDGNTHDAVVDGLANTGRVITSAALIMVFVFSSFVLNGDPQVKQFGLGMAVAIAVDSTIVRCLLVPALMVLIGRAIWWMPHWLDRLVPKISIEGEEFLRERPIPLGREDRDILALESATVAGHTCKIAVFDGDGPSLADLRASVASRLPDMLRRRLGGTDAEPAWVEDEGFDIEGHVVAGAEGADLAECVAELFAGRLDRSRPLWRMDLVGLREGGAALVWRIHHALADGQTCVRLAHAMLWDGAPEPPRAGSTPDHERRRAHLAGFVRREFIPGAARSPFDGKIGTRREVAFAAVPLRELHDAAKRLAGATLNDAVLAVVAGAVRRWTEDHHGRLGPLRVRVPVSLHHQGEDAGNRDSYFCVALPLGEADPVERLAEAHRESERRKAEHDAEEMDRLLRGLAGVSPGLERMCEQFEGSPRQFALSVSNVRGPAGPVSVLGSPVARLHFVAEIGERHALRVSVNSFAGHTLSFGFCADPQIVEGIETMAAGVEAEAASLMAA